ncbi:MAG TPA: nucleotidyltransferase domain-containing protein, partial [Steroidobacteraceae bacterium]|nr:nucleotidyltransferase domain-containing protein [Steroidobacteraceae bacterium]
MLLQHSSRAEVLVTERIADAVREIEPAARPILYGSRARGTAQPDSDWDLLLATERSREACEQEILQERLDTIFAETGAVVSPFWVSEEEWLSPRS